MLIPCPHCGPREVSEFTYIGDATKVRPAPDASADAWSDFVHARRNPRGRHAEHWQHTAGCRAIVRVTRDTVTHAVYGASLAGPWGEGEAR
ncbi:sarcosine oxidase subunit delta [Acuticoccus sp. M5D2P5]|uniref:sarcosine oxidase subunit delta n=1 Tax=Acuticoccus kalidii TaxID=2910977 RepID=UPI001F2525F5|nr:sarcosine oxidase subunit delta [Acuticoccus kalidii]MCF3932213.1 sarcosine oxidase subunit delta [Acuticoccus kalidii]